jgi:CheY-like chemotaxis protein
VTLYRQRQPDIAVVLTDMAMPVMDGSEAIIALKAINPEIRIIGMSGLDSQSSQAKTKGIRRRLKYFIEKPFTTETLLHTLHQVLHQQ